MWKQLSGCSGGQPQEEEGKIPEPLGPDGEGGREQPRLSSGCCEKFQQLGSAEKLD